MAVNTPYISSTQVASSTPFDNTQGNGYVGSDVQSALQELRDYEIYDTNSTATTTSGTLTLTAPVSGGGTGTAKTLQYLTGSATGYSVQMPSALLLSLGTHFIIANTSTQTVTIKDNSGATLFTLGQTSIGHLFLQAAGSAAGTWLYYQILASSIASGIISYNVVSSTTFATSASAMTLVTGMTVTPEAGTYGVWVSSSAYGSGSGQEIDVQIYNGSTPIVDSLRQNVTPAGGHYCQPSTQTISQFNGTNACSMHVNANGNSMTVVGRSLLLIRLGP